MSPEGQAAVKSPEREGRVWNWNEAMRESPDDTTEETVAQTAVNERMWLGMSVCTFLCFQCW